MKTLIKSGLAVVALSLCFNANALAEKYEEGFTAAQRGDYATAYRLWLPLANQGNASAQFNLGVMYDNGQGVPQDGAEAVKWYRKAAVQGNADAQSNLGAMYAIGEGVLQDYAEAAKWRSKAAEQGHVAAQFYLGLMYRDGEGVPQDYVQAHKWFNLAAANPDKALRVAHRSSRDLVAGKMTPAQIAEAQKLAREWKPKSSAPGK